MSRRALFAITLAIVAIALVALVWKFRAGAATVTAPASSSAAPDAPAPQDETIPPTSETLIAEALAAKDITYEESLRQRAYAIFDDPRLQLSLRTTIVNWEAMGPLLAEVAEKEATLSMELLDDLLPFRVRPNDPRSIVNRPRAEVLKTQPTPPPPPWLGRPVPGTGLMLWIRGTEADLQKYIVMASRVWRAFPAFFTYPLPDRPGNEIGLWNPRAVNPDSLVDVFLIDRAEADPRRGDQSLEARGGAAWVRTDPETENNARSSGYALIGYQGKGDDELYNLIAHELAHVSQLSYDTTEATTPGAEGWMMESTAEWVAYKVMTALAIRPAPSYRMIDRREPPPPGRRTWPQPPLFNNLHKQLHRTGNDYSGFVFFYSASLDLGDGIVKQVWQRASPRGAQGIDAVNQAIPLVDHFPLFTVRNWNRDPVLKQYKDRDSTFSRALQAERVKPMPDDLGTFELTEPVVNLSARYYRFRWSGPRVKKVTFQNFYKDLPNAHVWAIKQIGADWKEPEDWSRLEQVELCRESPRENVTELILIVSDSHPRQPIDPALPKPRVLVEDVGCEFIEGSAQSTLRLRGEGTDVTYVSSLARLRFKPRMVQDTPGKVDYDLMPTSVTWTVSGTRGGCRLSGQALVTIPAFLDQDLDPTRPAWGYMNVIGVDGGDFHSVRVSAWDPNARVTETCPGNPPRVNRVGLEAGWLSHVIYQKNTHQNGSAVFKGPQTLDAARLQDNIPVGPGQALQILQNSPGTAPFMTPEVQRALKEAQEAMNRSAAENSGKLVYTFQWDLHPMSGTPPSP